MRTVAHEPAARMLVGVLGAQFLLIGALDVLFVVLAVEVLDMGGAGAGYLNAAFGAGGVLGIAGTVALVGRSRLAPSVAAAALVWSLALLGLAFWTSALAAFLLFVLAGSARTLLERGGPHAPAAHRPQRCARPGVRPPGNARLRRPRGRRAAGAAPGGVARRAGGHGGTRPAASRAASARGTATQDDDEHADVPVVEVALLRSLPIFEPLSTPALEGSAAGLPRWRSARRGVIEEGAGDPASTS